jgi:hypothetical protein
LSSETVEGAAARLVLVQSYEALTIIAEASMRTALV